MIDNKVYGKLSEVAANVYPGAAPIDYERPCVIYNRRSTEPTRDLDDEDDSALVVFQIDVYSDNQQEAMSVAKTVRSHLKAWTEDGVQCASYIGREHLLDNTTQTQLFRVMMMFEVFGDDA